MKRFCSLFLLLSFGLTAWSPQQGTSLVRAARSLTGLNTRLRKICYHSSRTTLSRQELKELYSKIRDREIDAANIEYNAQSKELDPSNEIAHSDVTLCNAKHAKETRIARAKERFKEAMERHFPETLDAHDNGC